MYRLELSSCLGQYNFVYLERFRVRDFGKMYDTAAHADSVAPRLPAVGVLLLCDVSKREVSTQPKLTVLPHAYRLLVCWYVVVV